MRSSPDRPSRRGVMKKGLSAMITWLGGHALYQKAAHAARTYENTPLTPEDLAYFDELLRNSTALTDFQNNPTREKIERVIRALSVSSADWVPSIERKREALHAGARALFDRSGAFIGNGTVLRIRDVRYMETPPKYRYVLVTAAHVADRESSYARRWVSHPKGADVSVCEITPREATQDGKIDALHLGTTPERLNLDISGRVGVVLSRDNDTGVLKRKLFESMVSPRTSSQLFSTMNMSSGNLLQTEGLRLIVLPRGEEKILRGGIRPAQGVSGAAFLFVPEGAEGVEFAGIFVSIMPPIRIGQQAPYAVGHIVDHVIVREAISHLFAGGR